MMFDKRVPGSVQLGSDDASVVGVFDRCLPSSLFDRSIEPTSRAAVDCGSLALHVVPPFWLVWAYWAAHTRLIGVGPQQLQQRRRACMCVSARGVPRLSALFVFRVVPLKQGQAAAATIARIHRIHALDAPRPTNPSIDRRVDQSIQFSAPTRSICEWLSVADHHAHNPTDRLRPSSNGWDGWDDWMDGWILMRCYGIPKTRPTRGLTTIQSHTKPHTGRDRSLRVRPNQPLPSSRSVPGGSGGRPSSHHSIDRYHIAAGRRTD